jgi:hypothetical protein
MVEASCVGFQGKIADQTSSLEEPHAAILNDVQWADH